MGSSNTYQQECPSDFLYGVPTPNMGIKEEDAEMMTSVCPSEITGQSLASKMQTDKMEILQHLSDEPDFDLDSFIEDTLSDAMKVESTSIDETQDLIDEMDQFLKQYEQEPSETSESLAEQLLSIEQLQTLNTIEVPCPVASGQLTDDETASAEWMLDQLLQNVNNKESPEVNNDSGFLEEETPHLVSHVSQFTSNDKEQVIIIVTPKDESSCEQDSDSDWVSDKAFSTKRKPGRKPAQRQPKTGKVSKKSYGFVKDKKERKKLQNVEAARRYRDKKKLEQHEAEQEEEQLLVKNRTLRKQLQDIELELKTYKKIMLEVGLIKEVQT